MLDADRPFAELPVRAQVHRLRQVASAALRQYPITATSMRLLMHGYNTSFRVDTDDGRRFSMRINVGNPKSEAALRAELAWLTALSADGTVSVPTPLATTSGELRTSAWCASLQRDLPVVMMSWLPGRDLDVPTRDACRAIGTAMARLHDHADRWSLPSDAELPSLRTVMMDVPNRLTLDHPLLTGDRREIFGAAMAQVQRRYDEVFAAGPVHAIHADLHGGNVKWLRNRLSVFDFDDAAIGTPVHDLAISAYYLRDEMELEAALLDGYADVRPLPTHTSDQYEAIVASRNLVLLNDMLYLVNARIRAAAPLYVANATLKLRAYLDTGRYRHDVEGVVALHP